MVGVVKSATFDRWLRKLKDRAAAARVLIRIDRLIAGNPEGDRLILLLCGGDKTTQPEDIKTAHRMAGEWRTDQGRQP